MNVYMVRHTSVDVLPGTCYGQTDVPLKASFEEEAFLTKQKIDRLRLPFDKVFTSPLSRASRLADFCGYPEAERDSRLLEMNMGRWEMLRFDDIKDKNLKAWYKDYLHVRTTEGESFKDLFNRVSDFLTEMKNSSYKNVLLFAHGGVLLSGRIYTKEVTLKGGLQELPPYGSVIKLTL